MSYVPNMLTWGGSCSTMEFSCCYCHPECYRYYSVWEYNSRGYRMGTEHQCAYVWSRRWLLCRPAEQNVVTKTTTCFCSSCGRWLLGHIWGELFQKDQSSRFATTLEICITSWEHYIICKSHWCSCFSFILYKRILYWWQSHGRWARTIIGNSPEIV